MLPEYISDPVQHPARLDVPMKITCVTIIIIAIVIVVLASTPFLHSTSVFNSSHAIFQAYKGWMSSWPIIIKGHDGKLRSIYKDATI